MVATDAVEKHGLIDSGDGAWRGSRDGAGTIACEVVCCPLNRGAFCACPSAIKIQANGKCGMAEESLQKQYELAKEKARRPVDGD